MIRPFKIALALLIGSASVPALAQGGQAPTRDYMNDKFEVERLLDWGSRPIWSPDSKRIVFTRDDHHAGPAYEMELATRKVTCLTCRWGPSGYVARIYYLPDGSYLVLAPPGLGTGETKLGDKSSQIDMGRTELYWMPADASLPPQPLNAPAFGEIALDYKPLASGGARIAWGEFRPQFRTLTGEIVHKGDRAFLVNRTVVYPSPAGSAAAQVTFTETYDFVDDGKTLTFFTAEKGRAENGMFQMSLEDGRISKLPTDGQHNETHVLPDERYGLEESNRASDPSSPLRSVSGHDKPLLASLLKNNGVANAEALANQYGGRTFDLYLLDRKTNKRRRLTNVSDIGGEANQSSPARDGQHIVFAIAPPKSGPFAGKGGLYVGTFSNRK